MHVCVCVCVCVSVCIYTFLLFISDTLGAGLGLVFVGSITVIPNVFNRWKGVAFGLVTSGVGLGNLAFPFIIKMLEDTYGWRGSFLILSGIALHICFCGSLLSPASMTTVQTDLNAGSHQVNDFDSDPSDIQTDSSSEGEIRKMDCKTDTVNFEMAKTSDAKSFQTNKTSVVKNSQIDRRSDKMSFQKNCKVEAKNLQIDKTPGAMFLQRDNGSDKKSSQTSHKVDNKSLQMDKRSSAKSFQNTCKIDIGRLQLDRTEDAKSYGKKCIFHGKSKPIDHKLTATNFEMDCALNASGYQMNWKMKLKSFFNFLSPSIFILTCSNFLYLVGYSVFTNHMPAFTLKELALDFSERSLLVPSIGISTLLASWIQGALLDIPSLDCQVLYMVCYFSMGIAVGCVPFVTSYAGMLGLCVLFGFMYAANGAALAKITLLYSGSANFVSGYGCVNLGGGVGIVLGGPMAGEYA